MNDRRELLKSLLRGDISPAEVNPNAYLFIAHTALNGVIIAEDLYAMKYPGIPTEANRITPEKAGGIIALHKKGIFGVPFHETRDFTDAPSPWAPFGATKAIAFSGEHHSPTIFCAGIPAELLIIS
ncbi:MAG: hypothetical protein EAS52_18545 [Parapedobacter sp.]|nr:MAG: hypothetical protein EAS52_18545 [Parapedobacter sp.]